jgi:hypothetical protein
MTDSIGTARALGPDRTAEVTRRGQHFSALLVTTVADADGRLRVPRGARLSGRVADLARGRGATPPHVALTVEQLCGQPVHARVVDPPLEAIPRDEDEASVAGGTFAWLLMGGITFGMPGLLLGATLGQAAHTVDAAESRTVEGRIAAGTLITVELAAPLPLARPCRG